MASTNEKTFVSEEAKVDPKRIVVCCDDTSQSSTSINPKNSCPSNVTRLYQTLADAGHKLKRKVYQRTCVLRRETRNRRHTDAETKRTR
ncbi:uncharacterized protein BDZ99DRAFT_469233 [Mytilinidion resinicola]|uniref:T6SS Phospholipase effector Tle1-like catalytic domain-containing protein n=1 Tax=Mytilinidion resinicola TaxID=574789 RepID=A0A6A6Y131_9PEZI|nr:uncharacterized protein BDZ99DRAFT_469233 [Mytilinidion resinicola]KAF2801935.1 hypothetical protein BDZ99DRAFT_469233 [Mytilinidion resinicola]